MIIDLAFPPSVNRIWRRRRDRVKPYLDDRYATWKRDSDNRCMGAGWHKTPVKGRFIVSITLSSEKRKSLSDADNRIKCVLDWLQRVGIIENDRLADEVTVRWGWAPEGCRVGIQPVASKAAE